MIDQPTVFVLGAGASKDYGFQLGIELTKMIAEWISRSTIADELQKIFPTPELMRAREMAERLRKVESSVDLWLAQNPQYLMVGRYCIARFIAMTESEENLFNGKWYGNLFRLLLPSELPATVERLSANRVTFITFNYDRSLEQALFLKTQSMFGVHEARAAAVISRLPIIHVHGQVGRLPWQEAVGSLAQMPQRRYRPKYDPEELFRASTIRVISETTRETTEYMLAQRALLDARRIYFLGFGYDSQNLSRLRYGTGNSDGRLVQGTHYELPALQKSLLRNEGGAFGVQIAFDGPSSITTEYFREMIGA